MPIPPTIPTTEDASWSAIAFKELAPDKPYGAVVTTEEHTVIGQTVITRYTRPKETTVQALCGLDEADDFEAAVGSSGTLDWHRTNVSALLVRCETRRITHLGVAEASLVFLI